MASLTLSRVLAGQAGAGGGPAGGQERGGAAEQGKPRGEPELHAVPPLTHALRWRQVDLEEVTAAKDAEIRALKVRVGGETLPLAHLLLNFLNNP